MARYNKIPKTKSPNNKEMYRNVRYPDVPKDFSDTYVYTTVGDRFDSLAQQYYDDSSLWWVISIANESIVQNSLIPPIGSQIRIPSNISSIISKYNEINKIN